MSAMSLSSISIQRSSPGVPFSACVGARLVGVANRALPRPPRPPRATTRRWPPSINSPIHSALGCVRTTVPGGTRTTTSRAFLPCALRPMPRPPGAARNWRLRLKSPKVVMPGSTTKMTSPPLPPSPPSGPPRGTCASRRMVEAPSPPAPPATRVRARSANIRIEDSNGATASGTNGERLEIPQRVVDDPVHDHLEVNVRTGAHARASDSTDALAGRDVLPGRNPDGAEVVVDGGHPVAVVDADDVAAAVVAPAGPGHRSALCRDDLRAVGCRDVERQVAGVVVLADRAGGNRPQQGARAGTRSGTTGETCDPAAGA